MRGLKHTKMRPASKSLVPSPNQASLTGPTDRAIDLNEQGLSLIFQGKRKAGLEIIERALTIDPNNTTVLYNVAGLYLTKGKPQKALEAIKRACELEPTEPSFLNRLAEAYLANRKVNEAISAYEKLAEIDPGFEKTLLRLGTLYGLQRRWGKAETTLRQAMEQDQGNPRILTNLGSVLRLQGKPEAAIEVLKQAQKAESDAHAGAMQTSADIELTLALAHEDLENHKQALEHYLRVKELGVKVPDLERRIKALELKTSARSD